MPAESDPTPEVRSPGMLDVLELTPQERRLVTWFLRAGRATTPQVAAQLKTDPETTQTLLQTLVSRGFLRTEITEQETYYRAGLRPNPSQLPPQLWDSL